MITLDLLNMSNAEIENMCDVIKKLTRVSHWKVLKALLEEEQKTESLGYLTRQQLKDITDNTNVDEDIKFLVQHGLIKETCHYPKTYRIGNTELIAFQTECLQNLCVKYHDKPYYRY